MVPRSGGVAQRPTSIAPSARGNGGYWSVVFGIALRPAWLRFLEQAVYFAVFWAAGKSALSSSPAADIWHTVIEGFIIGVTFAAILQYQRRPMYRGFVEAVDGLDRTERSQAIGAINHGVVPTDATVRSAAIRLGLAYLGGRSTEQLKRQHRQNWIFLAFVVPVMIACAVLESGLPAKLYFLAVGLFLALVLPLVVRRDRRIQRNVALLTEGLTSR
jgi:hypothetical protein